MAKISNKMKIKNADGTFEDIQISYIGPNYTWAEGLNTTASGAYSHAESQSTIASGRGSHSEGYRTIAIGDYSHVEGYGASFSIKVTGDANAKTYTLDRTYTNIKIGQSIVYKLDEGKMKIVSCTITSYDESVPSITLNKTLSEVALDKATVTVYKGGVSSGSRSHAEGDQTTASGNHSHAEGSETIASGEASHAEGKYTAALGKNSHAEGYGGNPLPSIINMNSSIDDIINLWKTDNFLLAFGKGSHAEGHATLASNLASHAEGTGTISSGAHSHAEGRETIASGDHQHVQGKFNIEDTSNTYAHIVGNGTAENDRSNAHTLDWNGNAWFAGNVTVGVDNKQLATLDDVEDLAAILDTKVSTSTTINGKALSSNITLSASDVGAAAASHPHSYLPLSGGTLTGDLKVGSATIQAGNGQTVGLKVNRMWHFGDNVEVTVINKVSGTHALCPSASGTKYLGSSSYLWKQLYASTSTIDISDKNQKRDINDLDDKYVQLFDLVRPTSYYLINGDRVHTGFIAQEVEDAMTKVGLTAEELGFFCRDIKTEPVYNEDGEHIEDKEIYDEDGNPVYVYGLRYSEYIAVMAAKIKKLEEKYDSKIETLEKENTELRTELNELKLVVQTLINQK